MQHRKATFCSALAVILVGAPQVYAQKIQHVPLNGASTPVTTVLPEELFGTYRYEKKGEPLVELRADGTGSFQPHMVAPIPIKYWLLADENGKPARVNGQGNPNYRLTLVVQYGAGGGGNYPQGGYDAMDWTMNVEEGCAIILGERYKC
ncbi:MULTISPECIES: hypothetical protein [Novosphingobium]|uniref:hypothetical protein n=1 Tax=Novosphingobium TaxID=165696 RepID=UPI001CD427FB|nr:hypothetical protein [Novosphingobium percolationis]MCH7629596.1 hypothetical protein [Pseudomonadota bacterium]